MAILVIGFSLKTYIYSLYRWGFLHFRYLKCLVNMFRCPKWTNQHVSSMDTAYAREYPAPKTVWNKASIFRYRKSLGEIQPKKSNSPDRNQLSHEKKPSDTFHYTGCLILLLMEEILHHLGFIKPCKKWDQLLINWCRNSSISLFHGLWNNPHVTG